MYISISIVAVSLTNESRICWIRCNHIEGNPSKLSADSRDLR